MRKPNLFIIGEPKTGTTALTAYLNQHPDVFMTENPKETNHFATDWHEVAFERDKEKAKTRIVRSRKDYLQLFKDRSEQYIGEASTSYAYSKEAASNIHSFNPDAKIIYGVRHPKSFLKSYYAQLKKHLEEDAKSLKEALKLEEIREKGERMPANAFIPSFLFYRKRIQFAKHLKRFLKYFSPNQIYVYIYEEFKENNTKVMENIFEFLSLENIDIDLLKRNKRKIVQFAWLREFLVHSFWLRNIGRNIIPLSLRKKWGNLVDNITLKEDTAQSENIDSIDYQIHRLETLVRKNDFEVDLSSWKQG